MTYEEVRKAVLDGVGTAYAAEEAEAYLDDLASGFEPSAYDEASVDDVHADVQLYIDSMDIF